jgi:hypothetical protein
MHVLSVLMSAFNEFAKKTLAWFLVLSLSTISAFPKNNLSAVPPSNWGAVESLTQGTEISVRMNSGDRMDGRFLSLDAESIHLTFDGKDRIYPRREVAEVWQLRVPDRKLNGALIGMGAGTLAGVIGAVASDASFEGEDKWGVLIVLVGIGLGAAAGAVVDATIKGDRLLYRK